MDWAKITGVAIFCIMFAAAIYVVHGSFLIAGADPSIKDLALSAYLALAFLNMFLSGLVWFLERAIKKMEKAA